MSLKEQTGLRTLGSGEFEGSLVVMPLVSGEFEGYGTIRPLEVGEFEGLCRFWP